MPKGNPFGITELISYLCVVHTGIPHLHFIGLYTCSKHILNRFVFCNWLLDILEGKKLTLLSLYPAGKEWGVGGPGRYVNNFTTGAGSKCLRKLLNLCLTGFFWRQDLDGQATH